MKRLTALFLAGALHAAVLSEPAPSATPLTADTAADHQPQLALIPSFTNPRIPSCSPSLAEVRRGDKDPREYAAGLERCIPEIERGMTSGYIKGVRFNPGREDLTSLLTESYTKAMMEGPAMSGWIDSNIDSFQTLPRDNAATVLPHTIECMGNHVPLTICLTPAAINSRSIIHDGDIQSMLRHEIQHAKEFYNGWMAGGREFSYKTIKKTEFSILFIQQIMELRALYGEIAQTWKEAAETPRQNPCVSQEYMAVVMGRYIDTWLWLEASSNTPQEKETARDQMKTFQGIKPSFETGRPALRVDLYGKTGSFYFGK